VTLPTLATGISTARHSTPPGRAPVSNLKWQRSQRGFTLWELLIVVAIIAITVSMVQFSVGLGDQTRDLKRVGKDLGKLFRLLNQEAVFENRNFAISVQDHGYTVLQFDGGAWVPTQESFFKRFTMPESQSSELIIDDQVIDISSKKTPEPHILILSSGEMTPFEWRIRDKLTQSGIILQGNLLGSVMMTGPEPLG
jgi:general secretion pathway protein H